MMKKRLVQTRTSEIFPCVFEPSGRWCIVACDFENSVEKKRYGFRLIDLGTGESVGEFRTMYGLTSVRVCPTGNVCVCACNTGTIFAVDLPTCVERVSSTVKLRDVRDFVILKEAGELLVLESEALKVSG